MLEISKILAKSGGKSVGDLYHEYNEDFRKERSGRFVTGGVVIPTAPSPRPLTAEEIHYREALLKTKKAA